MAFPQVQSVGENVTYSPSNQHIVNMPSGIEAGDLLLLIIGFDGIPVITNWQSFNEIFNGNYGSYCRLAVGWKKATGSEGSSITITTSSSGHSVQYCFRITGAEDPDIQPPEASYVIYGGNANPDPSYLNPTGGAKDYLCFAIEVNDFYRQTTAFPFADNQYSDTSLYGNALACNLGVCTDELNQSQLNPGTFTIQANEQWVAATVAVHPAAEAAVLGVIVDPVIESLTINRSFSSKTVMRKIESK